MHFNTIKPGEPLTGGPYGNLNQGLHAVETLGANLFSSAFDRRTPAHVIRAPMTCIIVDREPFSASMPNRWKYAWQRRHFQGQDTDHLIYGTPPRGEYRSGTTEDNYALNLAEAAGIVAGASTGIGVIPVPLNTIVQMFPVVILDQVRAWAFDLNLTGTAGAIEDQMSQSTDTTALTDTWDRVEPESGKDGVVFTTIDRIGFDNGDNNLYVFWRHYTWDSQGQLWKRTAETKESVFDADTDICPCGSGP